MKKSKSLDLLILTKSLDGGTGSFIRDFRKISYTKRGSKIRLEILSLEVPLFRKIKIEAENLFQNGNSYPEFYFPAPGNIYKFWKELLWLKERISSSDPHLVFAIDAYSLILISVAKSIWHFKIKIISSVHNNLNAVIEAKTPSFFRPVIRKTLSYFFNKTDKVVCVSEGLSENLQNAFHLKNKPAFIYNGVAKPNRRAKPHRFKKSEQKNIATIARFTKQKDFLTLLKAFKIVKKTFPKVILSIIGDGPEKPGVAESIRNLNLEESVRLKGWSQNPKLLLNKSDIFVLSTNWEGFGYVLLESLSAGIPVISTDSPYGPSEILDSGKYGMLVPPKNAQKMADAISTLLVNAKSYNKFAKLGFERSKDFTTQKMLNQYRVILDGF